jgi:alcohol dehydrogenase class IV
VAGLAHDRGYRNRDYPAGESLVPHGLSVIVNAPSVFRAVAASCPERHLEIAAALGADTRNAAPDDAGAILAQTMVALMRATDTPSGIGAVGYTGDDLMTLAQNACAQQRLVDNAPLAVDEARMTELFRGALTYW